MVVDANMRERFSRFVAPAPTERGCLLWLGRTTSWGYGKFFVSKPRHRTISAHRVAWMLKYGYLQSSTHVLHSCDVPACVNIEHLFLGDNHANQRDAALKGRLDKKLSAADAERIRLRCAAGETRKAIATEFGVSQSMVSMIATGAERPHDPGPLTRAIVARAKAEGR